MKDDSTKVKAYHSLHINLTYVILPCSIPLLLNRMLKKRTFWVIFLACFCLLALSARQENLTEDPSNSSLKDNFSEVKPENITENVNFANEPALNDSSVEVDASKQSVTTLNDSLKSDKTTEDTSTAQTNFETTIESRDADNLSLKTETSTLNAAASNTGQTSNETQDSEVTVEAFNKSIEPVGSESHANGRNGKSQEDEPILTFAEFQELARHSKTKSGTDKNHHDVTQRNGGVLNRSALVNGTAGQSSSKSAKASRRSVKLKNVANADCGSKVLHSSTGAMNAHAVLVDSRDDYLIFESASPKWLVVELCELAILRFVELANFELFASAPRRFRLYGADRLPYSSTGSGAGNGHANSNGAFNTAGWRLLVDYEMKDNRKASQMFPIRPPTKAKTSSNAVESAPLHADVRANASELSRNQTDPPSAPTASGWNAVAKYVAVEIVSFYGHERFCPLTFLRVFGESVLDGELINEDDDELFDEVDVDYQFEATSPSVLQHVDMTQHVDDIEKGAAQVDKSSNSQFPSNTPTKQPDSSTLLANARNVVFSLVSKLFGIDTPTQAQASVHTQSGNQAEPDASSASTLRNLDGTNDSSLVNDTAMRKGINPRRSKLISSSASVLGSMAALCQAIFPSIASYDQLSSNLSSTSPARRGNSQQGLTPFSIGQESVITPSWQPPTARLRMKRAVNTDWCTQLFVFVPPECATKLNYSVRQLGIIQQTDSQCEDRSHATTNYSSLNLEDMFSNARCAYYFGAFAKHVHRSSPDRPVSLKRTALRLVGCYCDVLVTVTNAALRRTGWLNGKVLSPSGIISQSGAFSGTQRNMDATSGDSLRGASDKKSSNTSERDLSESTVSSTEIHTGRTTDPLTERHPENTNRLPNDTESSSAEHRKLEGETPFDGSASGSKEQPVTTGVENQGSSAHWPFEDLNNHASANMETDDLNEISAETASDNFSDLAQLEAIAKQLELPIPLDRLLINSEEHSKLEEQLANSLVQKPSENDTIPLSQTAPSSEPLTHEDAQRQIEPVGNEQRFDEDIDKRYLVGSTNLLASREASFAKLIQRVKQLQTNMSISMRYLDELSQRYRRQMDTLHRRIENLELATGVHHSPNITDLERRITALERNASVLQATRMAELDGRMNMVETRFESLTSNISNSSSQSTGMRTIILVLIASQCSSVVAIAYLVYTLKKLAGRLEIIEQGNSLRSHSHGFRADHAAHSSSNMRFVPNGFSKSNHAGLTHTHSEAHRGSHGDSSPRGSTERTMFGSAENLKPLASSESRWPFMHRNTVAGRSRNPFSSVSDHHARPHSADRVAKAFGTELHHPNSAFGGIIETQNVQDLAVMAGKVKRKRKKMKHDAETESHNFGRLNGDKKFIHQLNGAPSSDARLYRSN